MQTQRSSGPEKIPLPNKVRSGPYVLIGVTCYSKKAYCLDEFITHLKAMRLYYRETTNYKLDIVFIDNSEGDDYTNLIKVRGFNVIRSKKLHNTHETLTEAYNVLRTYFLERDYTHLFSIEQDVIVPRNALNEILSHNKEIVSGLYYLGDLPCCMIGKTVPVPPGMERQFRFEKTYFKYDFIDKKDLDTNELLKVYAAGLGVMLIKRNVLEKIKFRVWNNGSYYKGHNDMTWSQDCKDNGYQIYLDPTIKCNHRNSYY